MPANESAIILRIVDVNSNRAREGLRVAEDIARFGLEDAELATTIKDLRHAVTKGSDMLCQDVENLTLARNSEKDPGKPSGYDKKHKKAGLRSVLVRNIHRAQEAARVLEEFAAHSSDEAAKILKDTRFSLYSLEKKFLELL